MGRRVRKGLLWGGALSVMGAIVGGYFGWWSGEPTYGGKTVTEWLDNMGLVEGLRRRDETGPGTFRWDPSPETVAKDPAVRALLEIGPKAVPTLVKRIAEPADWPPDVGAWERGRRWCEWKWRRWRGQTVTRPAPLSYGPFQMSRKHAAAFALLALGTNAQGGFSKVMEAYAATPKHQSIYGTRVAGTPAGFIPSSVVSMAKWGLPRNRRELLADIAAALGHTNAQYRIIALEATRPFPEEYPRWKDDLRRLCSDQEQEVRVAALWALLTTAPAEPENMRLAEAALRDTGNLTHVRGFAAAGLGLAGPVASNALPALREALVNPDSWFQMELRTAIKRIETPAR